MASLVYCRVPYDTFLDTGTVQNTRRGGASSRPGSADCRPRRRSWALAASALVAGARAVAVRPTAASSCPRSCRRWERHRPNQPTRCPPRQPTASHPTRAAAARPRDRRSRAPWPARECGWPARPAWLAPTVLPRPRHPAWPHPAWRAGQYAWARGPPWPGARPSVLPGRGEYCPAGAPPRLVGHIRTLAIYVHSLPTLISFEPRCAFICRVQVYLE